MGPGIQTPKRELIHQKHSIDNNEDAMQKNWRPMRATRDTKTPTTVTASPPI